MRLDLTLPLEVPTVSSVNLGPTQCPTQVPVQTVSLVTNVTPQHRQSVKKGSTRPLKVPAVSPASQEPTAVHLDLTLILTVLQDTSVTQLPKQSAR